MIHNQEGELSPAYTPDLADCLRPCHNCGTQWPRLGTALTCRYLGVRPRGIHPRTPISCEARDLEPRLSFASLSFSQDNLVTCTRWWQGWRRRRDRVLQELLLAAGGNEARKGAGEGTWWSFPLGREKEGNRKEKRWDFGSYPLVLRCNAQTDLGTKFFSPHPLPLFAWVLF